MSDTAASATGLTAAPRLLASSSADAIFLAAERLLPDLERGHRVDAAVLRAAMEHAFGGSDADGAWIWKLAYDACEAAQVLFLRKFGPAMRAAPFACGDARHAGEARCAASQPHTPFRGEPGASAVLDADRAGSRRRQGRGDHASRPRAGTLGRHGPSRHLRRDRRRGPRAQRVRRRPGPISSTVCFWRPTLRASTPRRSTTTSGPVRSRLSF